MLIRSGLLLSLAAVCLQIAVFLQPLLPQQYQIAPVCETITRALFLSDTHHSSSQHSLHSSHDASSEHVHEHMHHQTDAHDHHDASHQCQYCTVYGNLVLPTNFEIKEVFERIQLRLLAFEQKFQHVWFVLQRLFLIPQGRAPPLFA